MGSEMCIRDSGSFVSDQEVLQVTNSLKESGNPEYLDEIVESDRSDDSDSVHTASVGGEEDPLYDQALAFVAETRRASISSVQRHLRVGYNRGRIVCKQTRVDRNIAIPPWVAYCHGPDLKGQTGATSHHSMLLVNQGQECCANIAATKHPDPNWCGFHAANGTGPTVPLRCQFGRRQAGSSGRSISGRAGPGPRMSPEPPLAGPDLGLRTPPLAGAPGCS